MLINSDSESRRRRLAAAPHRGPGPWHGLPWAVRLPYRIASVPDGAAEGPGGGATVPELLQRPDKPNSQARKTMLAGGPGPGPCLWRGHAPGMLGGSIPRRLVSPARMGTGQVADPAKRTGMGRWPPLSEGPARRPRRPGVPVAAS